MRRVLLIRHGETTWNREGRWQGHGDVPLSAEGRAQAEALARALRAEGALVGARVLCSDLARAHETASRLGLAAPEPDRAWRELDVGRWGGLTSEEVRARFPEDAAALRDDVAATHGGGESWLDLTARAVAAFGRLEASLAPGGTAVVVAHGAVLGVLVDALVGHAGRRPRPLGRWHNTGITRLVLDDTPGGPVIVEAYNQIAHLGAVPIDAAPPIFEAWVAGSDEAAASVTAAGAPVGPWSADAFVDWVSVGWVHAPRGPGARARFAPPPPGTRVVTAGSPARLVAWAR